MIEQLYDPQGIHAGRPKWYVAGFYFDDVPDRSSRVLLIQKKHPAWQAGYYNAIGGKVEPGETPLAAMCREMREEADVDLPENRWQHVLNLWTPERDGIVAFFRAFGTPHVHKQKTDEPLAVVALSLIHALKVLRNLHWLVPLAADREVVLPISCDVVEYHKQVYDQTQAHGQLPTSTKTV